MTLTPELDVPRDGLPKLTCTFLTLSYAYLLVSTRLNPLLMVIVLLLFTVLRVSNPIFDYDKLFSINLFFKGTYISLPF